MDALGFTIDLKSYFCKIGQNTRNYFYLPLFVKTPNTSSILEIVLWSAKK